MGPRRYGKTTLVRRVLETAEREGVATVLVDLQDVLSIAEIVVRFERAYERLKGRTATEAAPKHLDPVPLADVGDYVALRFQQTDRDAGPALAPLLEFARAILNEA